MRDNPELSLRTDLMLNPMLGGLILYNCYLIYVYIKEGNYDKARIINYN